MMDLRNTVLGQLLDAPQQAEAMAQRAQALQADATFWETGEQFDNHTHLPLWRAICAFKGANPAHWALSNPDQARTMQRHTTGDVSELLKEIVRLHDKAAGHAQAGGLKGFGDTAKSFKTTVHDLTEWAEKVGEAARQTPSGASEQRQAERWAMCEAAGLKMPTDTYAHYPRGIGMVAKKMGIELPSLREDLNKHRARIFSK
jgi:hypothetical protein